MEASSKNKTFGGKNKNFPGLNIFLRVKSQIHYLKSMTSLRC